jgi:dihydropyrimidinase
MSDFDCVVCGGTVVTASEVYRADIGIRDGRISAVGLDLKGGRTIDAAGLLVTPGGVDTHCHLEQLRPGGGADEESFLSGATSALAGGTTTVVPFSIQFKGQPIRDSLSEYHRRARASLTDYSFHQIITDPTDDVVRREIPAIVASGIRSLKVFLTYDPLHLDDRQYLRVLAAARRAGALVTVHCENYDAINWRSEALIASGRVAPKYHAWARPMVVEREATHRAIALAELVDQPIQIYHVSSSQAAEEIARAKARGVKVWGETCPQYLTMTRDDLDRPGFEGAKFMCSPAPREAGVRDALWRDIKARTLDVISSDHSGFCYDGPLGKRINGLNPPFTDIPNGVPGIAARLPLLFSEGVNKSRITLCEFVALTATNPADLFGLSPRKGRIVPGTDADLVLWDPTKRVTIANPLMQHAIDYTPYEGFEATGWPVMTIVRGRKVMEDGRVDVEPGYGEFIPRGRYDLIKPSGMLADGFDASMF